MNYDQLRSVHDTESAKLLQSYRDLNKKPNYDPNKISLSRKISYMVKKGYDRDKAKEIIIQLFDSDMSVLSIGESLDKLMQSAKTEKQKLDIVRARIELHKLHFGEKLKTSNLNMNVDVSQDTMAMIVEKVFSDRKKEEQEKIIKNNN